MDVKDANRYIFNITGTVKEIIFPSKAILNFKYNGKDEKAILLVHKLLIDHDYVEEHRLMNDCVQIGDILEFDGHVYDKGGFGAGKDKCNYYVMRAWKANDAKVFSKEVMKSSKANRPPHIFGTGWISEVFPRKGVLTFSNNGQDERVLFLASKVYIFEKRLGTKQALNQVLTEGDPVQFEAVPQDSSDNSHFCSWFANLVWKGRRPTSDEAIQPNVLSVAGRRGSIGSTGSSESNSTEGSEASSSSSNSQQNGITNGFPTEQVTRGEGYIAKIVSESYGLIWWVLQTNHLQSVWFDRKHTFLMGINLSKDDLRDNIQEGDQVKFTVAKTTGGPTSWVARQVLVEKRENQANHDSTLFSY